MRHKFFAATFTCSVNNFGEFIIVDDREWQNELSAVFRARLEKVCFRTDRGGHCGNDFFSNCIEWRVGHLSEELLEVIKNESRTI